MGFVTLDKTGAKPPTAAQLQALKEALDLIDVAGKAELEGDIAALNAAVALRILTSDIVNNLTSTTTVQPLSAAQGKVLKDLIDGINQSVDLGDLPQTAANLGFKVYANLAAANAAEGRMAVPFFNIETGYYDSTDDIA